MIHILHWNGRGLEPVEGPAALPSLLARGSGLTWIDLDLPTPDEARILSDVFAFHPLAIENCLGEVVHPKIDDYPDYLYIVVHGVVAVDLAKEAFRTEELDIFLGPRYLVTHHQEPRRSIEEVRERCRKRPDLLGRGSDFLLHDLLDAVVEHYQPALEQIESEIDRVEERIFSDPSQETLNDILALKRDVLRLRRIIGPQKEAVNRLTRREFRLVSDAAIPYFRDVYDHLFRMQDLTEQYRDLITGAMEAYLSMVSNRLNTVMKALTAVSTVILPMSLIAGIYGMNFKRMPELEWPWGYPLALGLMAAVGLGLFAFFKTKRWI
jgi:magnesium transporter